MTKAAPAQVSYNAGEFSPAMDARIDFETYPAGLSYAQNIVMLPQGGATFSPGTRFVGEIKDSASVAALIPFKPSGDQHYQIEAGDQYFRFYRNQQRLIVEATGSTITNGTFDTDITGWTDLSTGSGQIAHVTPGRMRLRAGNAGIAWAEQAVTVAPADQGILHVLAFSTVDMRSFGGRLIVQIGTTSGGYEILKTEDLGLGNHRISFVPNTGTIYVQFLNPYNLSDGVRLDDVRFLSNVPLEVEMSYAADDVEQINFVQSADVMYLYHPDYATHKVERRGDASWSVVRAFYEDGPWDDINPGIDLADANLIGNPNFDDGLNGWTDISDNDGYLEHDATQKIVFMGQIETASAGFGGMRRAVSTDDASAQHILHFQIVGTNTTNFRIGSTAGGDEIITNVDLSPGWYTYTFTPGVATFHVQFRRGPGNKFIRAGGVGAVFCYTANARLIKPSATDGTITLTVPGNVHEPFRSTDVGRLVRLDWAGREPAWGVVVAHTNDRSVTVRLFRDAPTVEPTESWRLGAWSDRTGWPAVGMFHQQRQMPARTRAKPQTIWGSQTGDFDNMRPDSWVEGATTVEDDDALDFTLAAAEISPIYWMISSRRLVIGTGSGQWAVSSRGAVLTPQDFNAEQQTSISGANQKPVQIDEVALFTHAAMRAVYDIGFDFEIEGYKGADLNILASHINREGVNQIVYASEPYANVWARLASGRLSVMTYKRRHSVVGWTRRAIAGTAAEVESLSVINGGFAAGQVYDSTDRDELWMIVKRTINGGTKRYIEVLEGFYDGPNIAEYLDHDAFEGAQRAMQVDAFHVDSGLTFQNGPTDTITGLDHLEGETVKIWADGAQQSDKVVTGGQITLDEEASTVQVGLGYDWRIRGLKLPYGAQTGPGLAVTKTLNKLRFVLRDSCSFEYGVEVGNRINFAPRPFRNAAQPMGGAVALFTGEVVGDLDGGYDSDPRIILRGDAPGPFTLLGLVPEMKTNERL